MPRGRPKKQKIVETNNQINNIETEEKPKHSKKEYYVICDLCGNKIYSSPRRIPLTHLTGMAFWYRNCKIDKLCICTECAEDLNNTVEKFILSKNKALKRIDI